MKYYNVPKVLEINEKGEKVVSQSSLVFSFRIYVVSRR